MLLLLTIVVSPTSAASYTSVGVVSGTSSVYSQTITGEPNANKLVITVYTVVGTAVSENLTYYLANGSVYYKISTTVNVNSNNPTIIEGVPDSYFTMESIIASGLNASDPTYPAGPYKINDTSSMTFAGATRTIDYFQQSPFNSSAWYFEGWWDQATGIIVKWNLWWPAAYGGPVWQNISMVSTTAWSASAPVQSTFSSTSIITIVGVGIVALIVGFVAGRHGKRKR
jgi:hypothetical protein